MKRVYEVAEKVSTSVAALRCEFLAGSEKSFGSMNEVHLTRPELGFTVITRAILGAGIALLLADRLNPDQRKAVP